MIHIKRCDFKIAIIIAIMLFRKYIDNTYTHNYLPTPPNGCLLLENFQYFYNNQSTMLQALRPNTKKELQIFATCLDQVRLYFAIYIITPKYLAFLFTKGLPSSYYFQFFHSFTIDACLGKLETCS